MVKAILETQFVKEMADVTYNMWNMGWDERNGGNVSCLLSEEEVLPCLDPREAPRTVALPFPVEELAGRYLIVTGTGKYFKNVIGDPGENLGVIRIGADGRSYDILWGYGGRGGPTSELPAHLMSHVERLGADPGHRVVVHTHATNIVAMTFVHPLEDREFTRTLWKMCTECLVVFPDGVGVLPWLVPGTEEIGRQTAAKMREYRLVVWPFHGIFGAGATIDETFGLIETVEKAAKIYMDISACSGGVRQLLTDEQLRQLADFFQVVPKKCFL